MNSPRFLPQAWILSALLCGVLFPQSQAQTSVSISAPDSIAAETSPLSTPNPALFRITRTGPTLSPLVVWLKLSGTASRNSDYTFATPFSTAITLPAGQNSLDLPVQVIDDFSIESSETIRLELEDETSSGNNVPYSIGSDRAIITLLDNEDPSRPPLPLLQIIPLQSQVLESDSATAVFRITRSGHLTPPLQIPYTLSGTATAGEDFLLPANPIVLPSGAGSIDVSIPVVNDSIFESPKSLILTLTAHPSAIDPAPPADAYGILLNSGSASITLISEDAPATPQITMLSPVSGSRQSAPGQIRVEFEASVADGYVTRYQILHGTNILADQSLSYTTAPDAGTPLKAGLDLTDLKAGLYSFRARAWSQFGASATSAPAQAIVTNIPPIYPVMSVVTLQEETAEGSTNPALFRILVDKPMPTDQYVVYRLSSAGPGVDFLHPSGYSATNWPMYWLTGPTDYGYAIFPKGSTHVDIPLQAIDDAMLEGTEEVILTLSYPFIFTERTFEGIVQFTEGGFHSPPYDPFALPPRAFDYDIGVPSSATARILDNDTEPTPFAMVSIASTDADAQETRNESEPPNPGIFTISRLGPIHLPLEVRYTLMARPRDIPLRFPIPVQATHGVDYTSLPSFGIATIPAGKTSVDLIIHPIPDLLLEGNEYIRIALLPSATAIPAPSSYLLHTNTLAELVIRDLQVEPFTPVVKIRTVDSQAYESGPSRTAAFAIERSGSLTGNLVVHYTTDGSAQNGIDYKALSGSVTIPAGSARTHLVIDPIQDQTEESAESVSITLIHPPQDDAQPDYLLSGASLSSRSAGASIRDALTPPPNLPRRYRIVWLKRQLRHALVSLPAHAPASPPPSTPTQWAIDASHDLLSWQEIGTTTDPEEFVDVESDESIPQRFYRFREIPASDL